MMIFQEAKLKEEEAVRIRERNLLNGDESIFILAQNKAESMFTFVQDGIQSSITLAQNKAESLKESIFQKIEDFFESENEIEILEENPEDLINEDMI